MKSLNLKRILNKIIKLTFTSLHVQIPENTGSCYYHWKRGWCVTIVYSVNFYKSKDMKYKHSLNHTIHCINSSNSYKHQLMWPCVYSHGSWTTAASPEIKLPKLCFGNLRRAHTALIPHEWKSSSILHPQTGNADISKNLNTLRLAQEQRRSHADSQSETQSHAPRLRLTSCGMCDTSSRLLKDTPPPPRPQGLAL